MNLIMLIVGAIIGFWIYAMLINFRDAMLEKQLERHKNFLLQKLAEENNTEKSKLYIDGLLQGTEDARKLVFDINKKNYLE